MVRLLIYPQQLHGHLISATKNPFTYLVVSASRIVSEHILVLGFDAMELYLNTRS